MASGFYWHERDHQGNRPQGQDLLQAGWQPLVRKFDWEFFGHLLSKDPETVVQKSLDFASDFADALGRKEYAWWANILSVFSADMQYELADLWQYITPEPPFPDRRYGDIIGVETPVSQIVSRNSIPIDYVLNRLQEIIIFKILEFLGRPDLIMQSNLNRYFYYPVEKFVVWEHLEVVGTIYAFWHKQEVWLEIYPGDRNKRFYNLIAKNIAPLVNKATYNLAVMLSGYQSRVGQVHSQFPIRSFPDYIQSFTDVVQQAIIDNYQLAVLVHGEPGTGKTAWTQAVAKEVLVPLGYVIFILDHDAVENFVPPSYLSRICLIINEADNLAQNRASQIAQQSNKTEHILSLLDGTLYQSVIDEEGIHAQQKLVVLMTCNTMERLDPAVLRKGRVDLTCEFNYRFV